MCTKHKAKWYSGFAPWINKLVNFLKVKICGQQTLNPLESCMVKF